MMFQAGTSNIIKALHIRRPPGAPLEEAMEKVVAKCRLLAAAEPVGLGQARAVLHMQRTSQHVKYRIISISKYLVPNLTIFLYVL
jgi:hypothetical protein